MEVPGQEVDQRKLGERLWKKTQARGLNREDATDRIRCYISPICPEKPCGWIFTKYGTALITCEKLLVIS